MKKMIFAICDDDRAYAEKIYEYMHKKCSETYDVILFTELEAVEEFMKIRRIEILLISAVSRALIKSNINAEHIFVLVDNSKNESEGPYEIFKYQAGASILKKVMQYCCEEKSNYRRNCGKPLSIIGVYSPVKKTFQTTFSIALGQILSQKGKALYINFECFSGFDFLMAETVKTDLMDLVYFWQLGGENFYCRLGSVIEQIGNLDYVPPVHSFVNYEGISGREWVDFLDAFEEYTDYEYLILDLSENVNGLLEILRKCSTVYTVTDERRISRAKLSQYEALLREYKYDDVISKTTKLRIPIFREIPEDFNMLPYSKITEFIRKEIIFEEKKRAESEVAYDYDDE